MSFIQVCVHVHEPKVKCFHCILELCLSTVGDAFGDTSHQRWLNADALYHNKVVYVKKSHDRTVHLTLSTSSSAQSQFEHLAFINERFA